MMKKKRIFIYPLTKEAVKQGSNDYVVQLIRHLSDEFVFVNQVSGIGLLDAVLKFHKTDIYYFNWIEDVPTKRFGFLQVILLVFLLPLCKLTGKKTIYFIHNNISHYKEQLAIKKFIVWLMSRYADLVLSHSNEVKAKLAKNRLQVFHHPIEQNNGLTFTQPFKYDLLVWGKVSSYKGITEFVSYVASSQTFQNCKILIAGRFESDDHYNQIITIKSENITVLNRFVSDEKLVEFFLQSRFVLFTYTSASVLSSAALCKSLSYEKEVIGPNIGSFKDLGQSKLIYTYNSFADLEILLKDLLENRKKGIDATALRQYIGNTSWNHFTRFLITCIDNLYTEKKKGIRRTSKLKLVENESI